MKIDEQVIMRFFKGECTEAEKKQVAEYLKTHREIMDGFFEEEDWLHSLNTDPDLTLPYNEDVLLQAIQAKLPARKRGVVRQIRPWLTWVAAACLAAFTIGALVYYMYKPAKEGRAALSAGTGIASRNDSVIWKNNAHTSESRYLSDGSLVCLEPGAVLRYKKDFEPGKRLLQLDGEAKFIVAKNKKRPFTVVARNVSTTAVGTVFTVNSNMKNHVTVKLQEGKVIVRDINHIADSLYLLPGEYCAFDGKALHKTDSLYYVMKPAAPAVHDKAYYFIDSTCQLDASHVVFSNTKLPAVFKALDKLYAIKINYKTTPDSVLSKSLYSGSFNRTKMKAADVLRMVSLINDLHCEQVDAKTYLISSN